MPHVTLHSTEFRHGKASRMLLALLVTLPFVGCGADATSNELSAETSIMQSPKESEQIVFTTAINDYSSIVDGEQ